MKNQLLFLWIQETEYTCFSDNGFCFSSEYDICFDSIQRELIIKNNHDVNVFEKENNITNITAIVGNNGVGKSTLLKFLLNLNTYARKLLYGVGGGQYQHVSFIAVYFLNGEIVINNYTNMKILVINNEKKQYIMPLVYMRDEYKIRTITTIYLSLDSNEDIPTRDSNSRFVPLTRKSINRIKNEFIGSRRNKNNPVKSYKSFNFENMLMADFYTSSFAEDLLVDKSDSKMYIHLNATLPNNLGTYDSSDIKLVLLVNLFKELEDEIHSNGYRTSDGKHQFFIHGKMKDMGCDSFVNLIKATISQYKDVNKSYYDHALSEINFFFKSGNKTDVARTYIFEIESVRHLLDMIKNNDSSFIYKFLSFELNKSDGELAYLKHFAYLYAVSSYDLGKKITLSNDILLMIDEIDVHLHPEWQRKLISNTIKVVQRLFEWRNTQIILTTHSPIVLSDFPTQNIIFVKKNDAFDRIVFKRTSSNDNDNYRTFGANIYDLYNDSFFFDGDAIVGDYAKNYINSIYARLKNMNESSKETIMKEIDLVGESVIRDDLLYLLNGEQTIEDDTLSKEELLKMLYKEKERISKLIAEMENN